VFLAKLVVLRSILETISVFYFKVVAFVGENAFESDQTELSEPRYGRESPVDNSR
jgi:hypothetical protein